MSNFNYQLPVVLLGAVISITQAQPSVALDVNEINNIAEKITVLIDRPANTGSGVIISKLGNTYYVLTAAHVVKDESEYQVITYDNQRHSLTYNEVTKLNGVDLAVIKFTSNQNYPIATLSNFKYRINEENTDIILNSPHLEKSRKYSDKKDFMVFISGFPLKANKRIFNPGILLDNSASAVINPQYQGYQLVYSNLTAPGVSGGAVLDTSGRLIGIHGHVEGEENDNNETTLKYKDNSGKKVTLKLGNSLGIPINTFLKLAPRAGINLSRLKVENSPPPLISKTQITPWIPPINYGKTTPFYWINRANQLWRLGNLAEALESVDKAIQLDPKSYESWFAKGFMLGFSERYQEALIACSEAIKINPQYYNAWRCQAGALKDLDNLEEALISLDRALEINSKNPSDLSAKGEILFGLKKYQEAIQSFNKAIEINPDIALIWSNKALAFSALQKYDDALIYLQKSLEIDPYLASTWNKRGSVLQELNRLQEALNSYEKAIELDSDYATAWNNRGTILYKMQRYPEAIASFDRAIKIQPDYQLAIENREEALRQMKH